MKSFAEYRALEEAVKIGTKVKIHAPGKDYHGEVGHVGEIRHGAYKGAPKTYTVDYGNNKSIQLDKKEVKVHKEEVELDEEVEQTHVFHATVTKGRSGVLGSVELHHVKASSKEEAQKKLAKDLAFHDRKIHRLEYQGIKEEVDQLEEMTQGKEYTQAQLQKKIQSGNWEATHDIKPGKHVEMRHHSGKRVTVQVKEEVDSTAEDLAEGTQSSIEKKIQAKRDSLSLAREQRRAKGQHQQGQREIKLQAEIDRLNTELTQLKRQGVSEESELGDLAHQKTLKHRFLVTYSDPNHTSTSMRKEKQQKHVLVPGTKNGESVYKGDAEPLVKKYMKKQGYKVHDVEHVGMVSKKVNEDTKLDEADGKDYHSVHVNGRMWKTFDSKSHADNVAKKIKGATVHKYDAERLQQNYGAQAAARNAARGKQWDENTTTENKTL